MNTIQNTLSLNTFDNDTIEDIIEHIICILNNNPDFENFIYQHEKIFIDYIKQYKHTNTYHLWDFIVLKFGKRFIFLLDDLQFMKRHFTFDNKLSRNMFFIFLTQHFSKHNVFPSTIAKYIFTHTELTKDISFQTIKNLLYVMYNTLSNNKKAYIFLMINYLSYSNYKKELHTYIIQNSIFDHEIKNYVLPSPKIQKQKTNQECWILKEIPKEYRQCTSRVPHIISNDMYLQLKNKQCFCTHPIPNIVYHNT